MLVKRGYVGLYCTVTDYISYNMKSGTAPIVREGIGDTPLLAHSVIYRTVSEN